MKQLKPYVLLFAFLFSSLGLCAQKPLKADKEELRSAISEYFAPPAEFVEVYGDYRSPLKFYDGKEVKNKEDWEKRRTEIKNQWMSMMGEWPALLTEQELEIISQEQREDFTQYKVRFYWLPNQQAEGIARILHRRHEATYIVLRTK